MPPPYASTLAERNPSRLHKAELQSQAFRQPNTAVVIGGGIHGITAALALRETGIRVVLVDRKPRLLQGTSAATHNRAHLGYHYPRSPRTAEECKRGLQYFKLRYPEALYFPNEAYYLVEQESKVSSDAYARFCDRMRFPYQCRWPSEQHLLRDRLVGSFLTPEPCFNLGVLERLLHREIEAAGIELRLGWNVIAANHTHGTHRITLQKLARREAIEADVVINATYAHANNTLSISNLANDRTPYTYHTTEVVVARYRTGSIPAMTVMDGPFISLMPLAGRKNCLLVYDVAHSIQHKENGLYYVVPGRMQSNWERMKEHGRQYFPFMDDLEYVDSLWGARPVPVVDRAASRMTKIVAHESSPGYFSILEGKFISAPLIAEELVQKLHALELL